MSFAYARTGLAAQSNSFAIKYLGAFTTEFFIFRIIHFVWLLSPSLAVSLALHLAGALMAFAILLPFHRRKRPAIVFCLTRRVSQTPFCNNYKRKYPKNSQFVSLAYQSIGAGKFLINNSATLIEALGSRSCSRALLQLSARRKLTAQLSSKVICRRRLCLNVKRFAFRHTPTKSNAGEMA